MVQTIFTSPLFVETILPFLLVFTLIFAVLEKTKILGDGKRQIDALVSFVIGLIFVAFGNATDIIVKMIPVLGVALVVILVFMILIGSLWKEDSFDVPNWLKIVLGILIAIVVAVTVLILTGGFDYISSFIYGDTSGILINAFLILVIIGAIFAVIFSGKGNSSGKDS